MKVFLIGYMGSGKSTIGKELATVLGFSFLDLDDYIISKERISITELFKTKGEIYFRKIETAYLKEVLNFNKDYVIALGGGTPCYSGNIDLIAKSTDTVSFYLKLALPALVKRLLPEKDSRPLISHLKTEEDLLEFIGKHLFERVHYYTKAKFTILTDNKSKQEIVEQIVIQLV
ncbi:MAG: shikimate kinase [Winogradskyella sp.]